MYIVQTLFSNSITITNNQQTYLQSALVKINYSSAPITNNEIWIQPNNLLFEENITPQTIEIFYWQKLPAFFKTNGNLPFDIFSAAFFLLSRYEEYLPNKKDMYGRFAHENSVAFKNNFLHLPLINLWLKELQSLYPFLKQQPTCFKFIPTYDIDIAYNTKHKGFIKNTGSTLKHILKLNLSAAKENILTSIGKSNDPFDVYDDLFKIHQKLNLQPIYFFLLANKRKGYDKNLNPSLKVIHELIRKHTIKYKDGVGIHPSWQSNFDTKLLKSEITILEKITNQKVSKSRQHYIKMSLPETYKHLINNHITNDYSMGYGSINGFRASYTNSFFWFDLSTNLTSNLSISPFCFMEANSFFEQKYNAQQAAEELEQFYKIVKSVDGTFITIFHNHFITEQPQWLAWREMYFNFLLTNFQ